MYLVVDQYNKIRDHFMNMMEGSKAHLGSIQNAGETLRIVSSEEFENISEPNKMAEYLRYLMEMGFKEMVKKYQTRAFEDKKGQVYLGPSRLVLEALYEEPLSEVDYRIIDDFTYHGEVLTDPNDYFLAVLKFRLQLRSKQDIMEFNHSDRTAVSVQMASSTFAPYDGVYVRNLEMSFTRTELTCLFYRGLAFWQSQLKKEQLHEQL